MATLRPIAAAAIVAFALYAGIVQFWAPNVQAGQDQESDNVIAVEHFLYDSAMPDAIIVGSSLAQHIPAAALGSGIVNLALAAGTPLDGLDIIARSGRVPRRIYVEINQIARPVDSAFVDGFFAEPGYTLKRFVKALRTTFEPANVLISLMRRAARGRDEVYYPRLAGLALHDALVAQERRLLDDPPDPAALGRHIAAARHLFDLLEARGASIVLFEMPVEPQLEHSPGVLAVRRAAHAAWPPDRVCWHEAGAAPAGLPTRDGIHLDSDAAAAFGASLVQTACTAPAAPRTN